MQQSSFGQNDHGPCNARHNNGTDRNRGLPSMESCVYEDGTHQNNNTTNAKYCTNKGGTNKNFARVNGEFPVQRIVRHVRTA